MPHMDSIELSGVDIRRFELFTRVGISAAMLSGGYNGTKTYYEEKTGRSFDMDMNLSRNHYRARY